MTDTKTVPVVSWVYWNGAEQGGGGFDWFRDPAVATAGFAAEVDRWTGTPVRVRRVDVPDVPADLDGQQLTDYLDSERLDDMEVHLPALAEHDTSPNPRRADAIRDLRARGWESVADDLADGLSSETVLARLRSIGEGDSDAAQIVAVAELDDEAVSA